MNKYGNSRAVKKIEFINEFTSIWNDKDLLSLRCKFNFHYFSPTNGGQDFTEWSDLELTKLFSKLKFYSENSLDYWCNQKTAGSGNVLEIYGSFPISSKTKFKEPKHIPIEAKWARFRLESKVRIIGFVISSSDNDKVHTKTSYRFDKNTFYLVFLDREHEFYITEKK